MKRLWAAVALILAVVVLAGSSAYGMRRRLENMQTLCETLQAEAGTPERRVLAATELAEQWKRAEKFLSLFVAHKDLKEVNAALTELQFYAENGGSDNIRRLCSSVLVLLENMIAAQELRAENIF